MKKARELHVSISYDVPALLFPATNEDAPAICLCHGLGNSEQAIAKWCAELSQDENLTMLYPRGPFPLELREPNVTAPFADKIGYAFYVYDKTDKTFLYWSQIALKVLQKTLEAANFLASEKLYLGGFSQGGYFAAYAAFNLKIPPKGLILISAHIPDELEPFVAQAKNKLNVLHVYSEKDPVIKPAMIDSSTRLLKKYGHKVAEIRLDEGHRIPANIAEILRAWIGNENS